MSLVPSTFGMAYLQRQSERFMLDRIKIERPTDGSLDPDTNIHSTGTLSVIYTGKARLSPTRGPREMPVGEEVLAMRDTDCYIPKFAASPRRDDLITVLDTTDGQNIGRVFRVTDVRVGTVTASKQMSCVQVEESDTWTP